MLIHSLRFRGFGPYKGEQFIDFEQLGDSSLYLINGETGAGKSTIIDVICFALFDSLADSQADPGRLRSKFAGPKDPTEVELVFENGQGKFRVIRTPAYQREKAKGQGETEEKATCTVIQIHPDGSETGVASNKTTAKIELQKIIGLTHQQFVQTIVLPQGEFATFLRADTASRTPILKNIFKTGLYERVVEILEADSQEARNEIAGITQEIRETFIAAHFVPEGEERDRLMALITNSLDDQLMTDLNSLLPKAEKLSQSLATELKDLTNAVEAADKTRAKAKEEFDAVDLLRKRESDLTAAKETVSKRLSELKSWAALAKALEISLAPEQTTDAWSTSKSSVDKTIGSFEALVKSEAELLAWPAAEAKLLGDISKLQEEEKQLLERQQELPQLLASLKEEIAAKPSGDEEKAISELSQAIKLAKGFLKDVAKESSELEKATKAQSAAAAEAKKTETRRNKTTQAWISGLAGQLAENLAEDEPCPVCGSLDHPKRASKPKGAATQEEMEEAAEEAEEAVTALAQADERAKELTKRLADAKSKCTMTQEQIVEKESELLAAQNLLQERKKSAEAAETAKVALEAEEKKLAEKLESSRIKVAALKTKHQSDKEKFDAMEKQVVSARGDYSSVEERVDDLKQLSAALKAIADAVQAANSTEALRDEAATARNALVERDGFGDLEAAKKIFDDLSAQREALLTQAKAAEDRAKAIRAGISKIDELCLKRKDLGAKNEGLLFLTKVFKPAKGVRFGLHVYVLRTLFENVVAAANSRFQSLLGGRYTLVVSDDEEEAAKDARSRHGLGLSVIDHLTGDSRPSGTLSGGETFCASLALALGLADVVRMTAGGVEIKSLFIDEGFGSLDSDALEEVMEMLTQLGNDGRRVGLISHVDEMKLAISEKINVKRASKDHPTELDVSWMN